jgi:hypothetical protein
MNAERDPGLICNETIAPREIFVRLDQYIDNCNLVPVNLFGGEQRPIAHANCAPDFPMRRFESTYRFGFPVRNVDPLNAFDKCVPANACRIDRRKLLDRKSFCRHKIERLERELSAALFR